MLFIMDEASGIPEAVFEVARGALSTEGAVAIMAGNPTRTSGYFYEAFKPGSMWVKFKVSSYDSTRVSKAFLQEMENDYDRDSAIFRIRVLGEFAKTDDDSVIPAHLVIAAQLRNIEQMDEAHDIIWGLDVARYGNDDSVLVERVARKCVKKPKVWSKLSTMDLAGRIVNEYRIRPPHERPHIIYVDVIGVGAGVVDSLSEQGLPVVGVNVSELPNLSGQGLRLRDDLWLEAKRWFETREVVLGKGEDFERLKKELTVIKISQFTSTGKIKVQSKDELRRAGFKSPDTAEAFILTFAGGLMIDRRTGHLGASVGWSQEIQHDTGWVV